MGPETLALALLLTFFAVTIFIDWIWKPNDTRRPILVVIVFLLSLIWTVGLVVRSGG